MLVSTNLYETSTKQNSRYRATTGIGLALTQQFLSLDNEVIAVGRNQEKLQALAAQSSKIHPFVCDLSQATELENLLLFVEQQHPDLNILVNNAGIHHNYLFQEEAQLTAKIEQEVFVNLLALEVNCPFVTDFDSERFTSHCQCNFRIRDDPQKAGPGLLWYPSGPPYILKIIALPGKRFESF